MINDDNDVVMMMIILMNKIIINEMSNEMRYWKCNINENNINDEIMIIMY